MNKWYLVTDEDGDFYGKVLARSEWDARTKVAEKWGYESEGDMADQGPCFTELFAAECTDDD